jgi:CHASE3 domain sensor protein
MSRALEKNLLVWLVCTLAPIGIIGYICQSQTAKVVHDCSRVIHSHEVREKLDSILNMLNTAETSVRGYVITGKPDFLGPYLTASPQIEEQLKLLGSLIADNPDQLRRLHELQPVIVEKLDGLGSLVLLAKQKGLAAAAESVTSGDGQKLMEKIRLEMGEMQTEEDKLLASRSKQSANDTARATNVTTIMTVFALILVACNVFFARLRL